jgi:hypothetical protein
MKKTPKRKRSYRKVRIELTPAQLKKIQGGRDITVASVAPPGW